MKRFVIALIVSFVVLSSVVFADSEKEEDRVQEAGTVLKEILDIPDDIPKDLLE